MIYAFAELELDTRTLELRRQGTGEVIGVEPQVFDVLRFLIEHHDRVVPKEELLDCVWGTRFVTESTLSSRIKSARKAVGDDGRAQRVIRTVHARGYRFVAPLGQAPDTETSATTRASAPVRAGSDLALLLERREQLATLVAALDAARGQAEGSVVLIAAEAGLGKTTLVRSFAAEARSQGVRVLTGGCDDLVTARTMGPLRDIASEIGGPLGETFAGEADPEQVFAALPAVLAESPTVLVIEDLHWADDATLDVIRFLARRVSTLPTVLVATYRDEEVVTGHRLRRVLGSLTGPSITRMGLAPLSLEAVATLAMDAGVSAQELHAVTGGNPFFVTEVLAAGGLVVSPTIRDAVLSRIDASSRAARELLEQAAVIPSRAERWLLAELMPSSHVALAEAEQAGVLSGDETHVWFRHELARQAVEESLTTAACVRANQRVLDVLARHEDVEPARMVHHAERAGDVGAVIDHAPVAAEEAIRLGSYSQAIHHLDVLLTHADRLAARTVAITASRLSYALYMVNRFADSAHHGWRGVAAAEEAGDPTILADALRWLARTVYWSDGPREASAAMEQALPLIEELGDRARLATAHAELARARSDLVAVGPVAEPDAAVVEHATRSLELAEQLDQSHLRSHALQYRGTGRLALGDVGGATDLALAVELALLDPRDELPARACVNAAGGSYRAGRLDEAERYALLGLERATGGEFAAGAYRLELTLQGVRLSRGAWDEAEAGLRSLVEWAGEPGIMRPLAASLLVRLLARQGRHDAAADVLGPAIEAIADSREIAVVGPVCASELEAAWLAGQVDRMPAIAAPTLALAGELGHRTTQAELTRYLQRAGHRPGPLGDPVGPWAPGIAGRWRQAAEAWGVLGCRYERALELALAPEAGARAEGRGELEALGAAGALAAVNV